MLGIFIFVPISDWFRKDQPVVPTTVAGASSGRFLFRIVDLCFLQLSGVVDVNRFPFTEYVVHGGAGLTVAVAGILHAAERKMDFSTDGGAIDISDTGFDITHGAESALHIARINGAGQTVGRAVDSFDRLLEALHLDDGEHGTKDFFLRNAHRRTYLIKDRRPVEITIDPFPLFIDRSADEQPGALPLADLHVSVDLFSCRMINQRTHFNALVQSVTNFDLLCARHEHVGQLFFDIAMENQTASRSATLSRGAESSPQGSLQGEV